VYPITLPLGTMYPATFYWDYYPAIFIGNYIFPHLFYWELCIPLDLLGTMYPVVLSGTMYLARFIGTTYPAIFRNMHFTMSLSRSLRTMYPVTLLRTMYLARLLELHIYVF
jgi:hypothetical protein